MAAPVVPAWHVDCAPGMRSLVHACRAAVLPGGDPRAHASGPAHAPQFCDDCWRGHLRVQIGEGKARHVVCMAHKCNIVCDEELVAKVMQVRMGRARMAGALHVRAHACAALCRTSPGASRSVRQAPVAHPPPPHPPQAEPEVFAKYAHSHMQSYLEDNARVAFCPSAPWCGNAVEVGGRAAGPCTRARPWRRPALRAWLPRGAPRMLP